MAIFLKNNETNDLCATAFWLEVKAKIYDRYTPGRDIGIIMNEKNPDELQSFLRHNPKLTFASDMSESRWRDESGRLTRSSYGFSYVCSLLSVEQLEAMLAAPYDGQGTQFQLDKEEYSSSLRQALEEKKKLVGIKPLFLIWEWLI